MIEVGQVWKRKSPIPPSPYPFSKGRVGWRESLQSNSTERILIKEIESFPKSHIMKIYFIGLNGYTEILYVHLFLQLFDLETNL